MASREASTPSFLARLVMNPMSLFAVFADAAVAAKWNPANAMKAQNVSGKFNTNKATQAVLAIGKASAVALPVKAILVPSVDVWQTAEGVGLLDFSPAGDKLPSPTNKAAMKKLASNYAALSGSSEPRVAGTLEISSGMLAVFESGEPFPITAKQLADKQPVEAKGAVAVPLENGSYTVRFEVLGPDVSNYHVDELGMYRRRIRIERS